MQKISDFNYTSLEEEFSQENIKTKFDATKLCLDSQKRYKHCKVGDTNETIYASYIRLIPMGYVAQTEELKENYGRKDGAGIPIENPQGYIIDARVITKE